MSFEDKQDEIFGQISGLAMIVRELTNVLPPDVVEDLKARVETRLARDEEHAADIEEVRGLVAGARSIIDRSFGHV